MIEPASGEYKAGSFTYDQEARNSAEPGDLLEELKAVDVEEVSDDEESEEDQDEEIEAEMLPKRENTGLLLRKKSSVDQIPIEVVAKKGSFLEEEFFMTPRGQDKEKEVVDKNTID